MGSESPHVGNADAYNQPSMAPAGWWKGLMVDKVLIVAGKDEILVDDIVAFAETLEKGMALGVENREAVEGVKAEEKVTLFVAEGECHDQTNLDVQFGYKEPGEQAKFIRRWIGSKI